MAQQFWKISPSTVIAKILISLTNSVKQVRQMGRQAQGCTDTKPIPFYVNLGS